MKMIYAVGACLLMAGLAQAQILIDEDFATSSISNDQVRITLAHAGDGSGDDWKSRSDSLWNISGGNLNNPGTTLGRPAEGGMGQLYTVTTTDPSLTALRFSFDYTVGTGSTLFFHATGLTQNGTPAANEQLNNLGAQNGNVQNQSEDHFADINIFSGTDSTGAGGTAMSFASGTSGMYDASYDLSGYSWSGDEAPGVTGSLGNVTALEYLSLMFASDVTDDTGAGAISIDNFQVEAIVAPFVPPSRFQRIDLDGSNNSVINGSFEDVVADVGGDATANGAIKDSSTSFAANIANPLTVTQWAPYDAEDPNDVIGRYGTAGSVTTDSFYLDTTSVNNASTDGARGTLMNSTDGYRHGLVNEDVLAAIDPQFINPDAEYEVTVDLLRRNANTLANDTATATLAITDSATAPSDLSNAITGGLASVNQGSLAIGATSEALTLTISGADLINATQLNLVVDTVNTLAVGVETTPGQDVAYVSQIAFDNIVVTGYLPGDSDGDFDIEQDDIDALYAAIGQPGDLMDINNDGSVDADDIGPWLAAASSPSNPFNVNASTFVLGDANLDGKVDSVDLGLLLNNFGDTSSQTWMNGNMNGDANVDSVDLGLLLNNFGFTSVAAAAVPEPGCLSLVFFAVIGLMVRTRRSRLR